ncbi:LamG domain-containing protein [Candidatus Woesearchaeota archaeon]|nr:LamG domain-containing protein [Candidatus Woesearchaeota archaeon]
MVYKKAWEIGYIILVSLILTIATLSIYFIREAKITGRVVSELGKIETDPSIVLKLTFDDQKDPWKDYSLYDHKFIAHGDARWADQNVCKWYGCADFTKLDASDYIETNTTFNIDNGMAISFWAYWNELADSTKPFGYFLMSVPVHDGNQYDTLKWCEETDYGMGCDLEVQNGRVGQAIGANYNIRFYKNKWVHYFISYDNNYFKLWRDGKLVLNKSYNMGKLKYTPGELLFIGKGVYDIDMQGYIDEFYIWNRTNFTNDDVKVIYDFKKLGTPPKLDIYVKDIKYTLPIDWSSKYKTLMLEDMPIITTIANAGTNPSDTFEYSLDIDGSKICSGKTKIGSLSEVNITCNYQPKYGFHSGFFNLNLKDENLDNNKQRVYIPFLNRPFFHFNLDEWDNDLKPYCQDKNNKVAYSICVGWLSHFSALGYFESKNGNDVDPRGKNGRMMAMGCMYNGYNPSSEQCKIAMSNVIGWANLPTDTYDSVQQIHELAHVGMTVDLMFPMLDEEAVNDIARKYHDICEYTTNLQNTRPDLDDDNLISGDNGKGFGSGMGTFCYSLLGLYKENPTLIQKLDQQYWGKNIPDEWMDREISYLRSYKNDAFAHYQERWNYKNYAEPHLLENLWFEKRYGINDLTEYNNAFCAMARESLTDILDYNYNGLQLRNDRDKEFRAIQNGDSYSYQIMSDGNLVDADLLLYEGLLCDDKDVKSAILWIRDKIFETGEGQRTYPAAYLYKLLRNQAEPKSPNEVTQKVIFDNANDILTIRTNYTYFNDNVIQIDGGEEKSGGHSQAQGYYLYALGEPFLDYEQVPYQDDVRAETWKNGISLQNDVQTAEGQTGFYSANCGNAPLNQYYGMSDCPVPAYPNDYPDYRQFPLKYGGDLEDYIGTSDAKFAGVYVWRPYKNADDVREYFVKFGDLLAKRTIVSNNKEGQGVYHNFIDIYNEFTETRNENDLTLTRNNKNLDISLVYSNQTFTLGGGQSNLNFCFAKTDCSGNNKGNGKYRRTYLYTPANDVDFILAHHWYTTANKKAVSAISGNDNGLQQENNIIIFDTDNDGKTAHRDKEATGWALAYNDGTKEIAAFNTTSIKAGKIELLSAADTLSAHIQRSEEQITLTVNTMQRNKYIDYPKTVTVTIDAKELKKNKDFSVTKNGNEKIKSSESGTKVTFDVISGQNSDYYTITGGGAGSTPADVTPPAITFLGNDSTTNQSSVIKAQTDESANLSVSWGYAGNALTNTVANTKFHTTSVVTLSGLIQDTMVYYNAAVCDSSGNCASSKVLNFTTAKTYIPPNLAPTIASFQPSNPNPEYNFTTTIIFNITGSDNENDKLTLQWHINKTLNATGKNLTYTFSKIGIFNVTAILSDNFSNTSRQWIVTIINDTQQALLPTILKTGFSPPTFKTDIYWQTSNLSDSKVDYGTNSSLGTLLTDSKQTKEHMLSLANLAPGATYYFKVTSCNDIGCDSSGTLNFTTIIINISKYDGSTTDFAKLDGDNITNLTIEKSIYGKINFNGRINITRTIDIGAYTNITSKSVFVDTANVPELNVPATIVFYNLTYTNPRILRDGIVCPDTVCRIINSTGSEITFNVTGFSTYTVEETPIDTSSTTTSSGGSASGGGGSSGGGGGGSLTYVCSYEWQCRSWSECKEGVQKRQCDFVKVAQHSQETPCGIIGNPLPTSQTCPAIAKTTQQPTNNAAQPQAVFTVKLQIPNSYKKVNQGSDLRTQAAIQNLGQGKVNLTATYTLKNSKGEIAHQAADSLSLDKILPFTKTFRLASGIEPGDYTATIKLQHENVFASSSDSFTVIKKSKSIFSRLTTNFMLALNPGLKFIKNHIALALFALIVIVFSVIPVLYFVRTLESARIPKELTRHEAELYKYIIKALQQGHPEENIRQVILKAGWKEETADRVIGLAANK